MLEKLLDNLNLEDDVARELERGWTGVKVTLIDYTLSRAKVDDVVGEIAHYGFEDESLFEGKRTSPSSLPPCVPTQLNHSSHTFLSFLFHADSGDYQFDIYRQMRSIVTSKETTSWSTYKPLTNVLWLHYLAHKLLYSKNLPTPVSRLSARNAQKRHSHNPSKRGHERSFSVILEGEDKVAYEGLVGVYGKLNPKVAAVQLGSAGDVLELGREVGWVV